MSGNTRFELARDFEGNSIWVRLVRAWPDASPGDGPAYEVLHQLSWVGTVYRHQGLWYVEDAAHWARVGHRRRYEAINLLCGFRVAAGRVRAGQVQSTGEAKR